MVMAMGREGRVSETHRQTDRQTDRHTEVWRVTYIFFWVIWLLLFLLVSPFCAIAAPNQSFKPRYGSGLYQS
jgi:preprotein translocase subunit Sec63